MKRSYLDPIHQEITLDRDQPEEALVIDLIDTKEFQRLRRIHQMGVLSLTFHGAEGSRFTHSLGAMHVANQVFHGICQSKPHLRELRGVVLAAALLHDIGHGPFSHDTERILSLNHEHWSCRIIAEQTEVNQVLSQYGESSDLAEQVKAVLNKTFKHKFVSHLISSQLDCDRFDYLLRDSYMTGTIYGLFALRRVISALEVDEKADRILVVGEKGQAAVEDYLFARYSMYSQVYYHKKNLAACALLRKLMKRAKYLIDAGSAEMLFVDDATFKWLTGANLCVEEYLSLDDTQLFYHIKRWAKSPDQILSDLALRFLNRHLFKSIRLIGDNLEKNQELETNVRATAKQHDLDPDYYVALESSVFRPYDFYKPESGDSQANIMVRTETGEVRELSELSLPIEALVRGKYEARWLVYPQEIDEEVHKQISPHLAELALGV
jgi:HD superfamily phosphohydrolase